MKVFNDTHDDEQIELTWSFAAGKQVQKGKQTFALKPGTAQETSIEFTAPAVKERTPAALTLTCRRGGKEVFREVKSCWIILPNGGSKAWPSKR